MVTLDFKTIMENSLAKNQKIEENELYIISSFRLVYMDKVSDFGDLTHYLLMKKWLKRKSLAYQNLKELSCSTISVEIMVEGRYTQFSFSFKDHVEINCVEPIEVKETASLIQSWLVDLNPNERSLSSLHGIPLAIAIDMKNHNKEYIIYQKDTLIRANNSHIEEFIYNNSTPNLLTSSGIMISLGTDSLHISKDESFIFIDSIDEMRQILNFVKKELNL